MSTPALDRASRAARGPLAGYAAALGYDGRIKNIRDAYRTLYRSGLRLTQALDKLTPVAASASLSVAVGDFQAGYQIVDRQGIRILRDPFTEKPFIKFYATTRVAGDVINFDAIKLLKLS